LRCRENDFSFTALRSARQCALNIATGELAAQVVACGNSTGAKVDKFSAFGLTPLPAKSIDAPLIGECYANFECRVVDTRLENRYNFFVLEIVKAWIDRDLQGAANATPPRTRGLHCGRRKSSS